MAIDRENGTTTQLLTLLNVSATKAGKRKWILDDVQPTQKLNKRRTVQFSEVLEDGPLHVPHKQKDEDEETKENDRHEHVEDVEEVEADEGPTESMFLSFVCHCHSLIKRE